MKLKDAIKYSFIEYYHFGWCFIYGFGFDSDGQLYERKKVKDDM